MGSSNGSAAVDLTLSPEKGKESQVVAPIRQHEPNDDSLIPKTGGAALLEAVRKEPDHEPELKPWEKT